MFTKVKPRRTFVEYIVDDGQETWIFIYSRVSLETWIIYIKGVPRNLNIYIQGVLRNLNIYIQGVPRNMDIYILGVPRTIDIYIQGCSRYLDIYINRVALQKPGYLYTECYQIRHLDIYIHGCKSPQWGISNFITTAN